MEDFLSFIVVIIVLVASLSSAAKKKKTDKTHKNSAFEPHAARRPAPVQSAAMPHENAADNTFTADNKAFSADDAATWTDRVNEEAHRGQRGELHPTERVLSSRLADIALEKNNAEGNDPCHAYMLDDPSLPSCADEMDHDYDASAAAAFGDQESASISQNELLRGVVMAEILTRPAKRRPVWRHS